MIFVLSLIALSYGDYITLAQCEGVEQELVEVNELNIVPPASRYDSKYIFRVNSLQDYSNITLRWEVWYYWGSLYITSYQFKDVDVCAELEKGCPLQKGQNQFSARGGIESVALPGWYKLYFELFNLTERLSCYWGWVFYYY